MPMRLMSHTKLDSIGKLVSHWGIADDWDVLLVGDGSGSGWELPTGWACTLIDRHSRGRQQFYGGSNFGTINIAELIPYIHAMAWYSEYRKRRQAIYRNASPVCRVHIVTDHNALEQIGKQLMSGDKSLAEVCNGPFWSALLAFRRQGFDFHFHWLPRASIALNCYADEMAKIVFKSMKVMLRPLDDHGNPISIHACNPDRNYGTRLDALKRDDRDRKRPTRRIRRQVDDV